MFTYIDSCQKESERHAEYPKQSTVYFENIANIITSRDCVIPQEKKNGSEEDRQADPYEINDANKSIE